MTDADHGCKETSGIIKNQGTGKKSFSLVPRYALRDITNVTAGFLEKSGVRFLMIDLDNTIAAYDEHTLTEEVSQWIEEIKAGGIELFIISNSTRTRRVESYADLIGTSFIMQSYKPSPKSILRAMEITGYSSGESALAGDQILTDTLAANRAGVISIIVRPKRFTNPFLAVRYFVEIPFRALCKNKMS